MVAPTLFIMLISNRREYTVNLMVLEIMNREMANSTPMITMEITVMPCRMDTSFCARSLFSRMVSTFCSPFSPLTV